MHGLWFAIVRVHWDGSRGNSYLVLGETSVGSPSPGTGFRRIDNGIGNLSLKEVARQRLGLALVFREELLKDQCSTVTSIAANIRPIL